MTTAAKMEIRSAKLSSDFGYNLLLKKAGNQAQDIIKKFGLITRGPNKGKPRGYIMWIKVYSGGWDYNYGMGVMKPGSYGYKATAKFDAEYDRCEVTITGVSEQEELTAHIAELEEQLVKEKEYLSKNIKQLEIAEKNYAEHPSDLNEICLDGAKCGLKRQQADVDFIEERLVELRAKQD